MLFDMQPRMDVPRTADEVSRAGGQNGKRMRFLDPGSRSQASPLAWPGHVRKCCI